MWLSIILGFFKIVNFDKKSRLWVSKNLHPGESKHLCGRIARKCSESPGMGTRGREKIVLNLGLCEKR